MTAYKDYLGDGVYVDFDGWNIVLTAENGFGATDTIYIEPEVLIAFNRWLARVNKMLEAGTGGAQDA